MSHPPSLYDVIQVHVITLSDPVGVGHLKSTSNKQKFMFKIHINFCHALKNLSIISIQSCELIKSFTCSLGNKTVNLQYEENNQEVTDVGNQNVGDVEAGPGLGQFHARKYCHNCNKKTHNS